MIYEEAMVSIPTFVSLTKRRSDPLRVITWPDFVVAVQWRIASVRGSGPWTQAPRLTSTDWFSTAGPPGLLRCTESSKILNNRCDQRLGFYLFCEPTVP